MRLAENSRLLIITAWVGSLWTVGYLVAPTLFIALPDRVLAGTIAGKLFRVEAWFSVVAGTVVLLLLRLQAPRLTWSAGRIKLVAAMLACTLLGYFALQPSMAAMRETTVNGVMNGDVHTRFALLHGVASALYLIQSLLGIILVVKNT